MLDSSRLTLFKALVSTRFVTLIDRLSMAESLQLLSETVLPEEIQRYRTVYEKAKEANQITDQNKFSFAYCLVRSKVKADVRHGVQLLRELYDSTNDDNAKRDYLFYLAIGKMFIFSLVQEN